VKIAMVSAHAGYYRDRRSPHVVELSTALARAGHDVTVYTRGAASQQSADPHK
jgi:hypothetical protein